ncbi:MAG: transglycosylase domain-containing protein, partial [Candidatus Gastranaerophilales bacterium]|nr:transglycosylase domain-containing protein [Candidatus Gastranaerophilales bacterium]
MYKIQNYSRKGSCAIAVILVIAFILAGIASGFIYLNSLPPISQLKNYQPTLVSQIVSNDNTVIKTFGAYKYEKVSIKEIPDSLKKAIIATEDKNFYKHRGFDPVALLRSTLSNMRAGHVVQGASTITQQLARILFLSSEKTFDRKLKELIIAYRLEKTLPKDEILEMYLNNVYLGEGAYGVSAASKIYFNKSPKDLTLAEAALIAGLPQAPSIYSPYQNIKASKNRRSQVIERMIKMNYITDKSAIAANKETIKLNCTNRPYSLNKAPYFIEYVMKELKVKAGLTEQEVIQGGYKVYTTLNLKNQNAAQDATTKGLIKWGLTKPYQQAALISIDT